MFTTIINAHDLDELLGKKQTRIFDSRFQLADDQWGRGQFEQSHIPGARYLHLNDDLSGQIISGITGRHPLPSISAFEQLLQSEGLTNDDQVIVYDQFHGGLAARLWWMLKWAGHTNVAVLNGGWKQWQALGLPTSVEVVHFPESDYQVIEQQEMISSLEQVVGMSKSGHGCLIDARAAQRYRGEVEPIDPVAGHIPNAISIPFVDNVDENGLFKDKQELRARFLSITEEGGKPTFYCGSGVTACHDLLAYEYCGLGEGLLYPGSWSEWITDDQRAIATGADR